MTLPFAGYLFVFFSGLPSSLLTALSEFFMPALLLIPERMITMIGLSILVYSLVYLVTKKGEGLVTSGPYHLVRHPQYFGIILSTIGFTSWSLWVLNHTFGIGFLNPLQTVVLWFTELLAYVLLGNIEELYLSKSYSERFGNYKDQVPFLIPFLKTRSKTIEILISISVPAIILSVLISLGTVYSFNP
jgi:protein-S-isoprenylcysteine O-methyltransferase Ste14